MTKFISFIMLSILALNSYAYVNVPMPGQPGDAFLRGVNTGSNLFTQMTRPQIQREDMNRKWRQHQDNVAIQKQAQNRLQRQEEALRQLEIEIKKEQLRQLKNKGQK